VYAWNNPIPTLATDDANMGSVFGDQDLLQKYSNILAGQEGATQKITYEGPFGLNLPGESGETVDGTFVTEYGPLVDLTPNQITQYLNGSFFKGIRAIEFVRTKGRPDSQCILSCQGPLPPTMIPGSWIILSSISIVSDTSPQGEDSKVKLEIEPNAQGSYTVEQSGGSDVSDSKITILPRFFGQIHTVIPRYVTMPNGVISQSTVIQIREWSSLLMTPIRYDSFAIINQTDPVTIIGGLQQSKASEFQNITEDDLSKLLLKLYNPYDIASLVLALVGGLNEQDVPDRLANDNLALPNIATTMPSVPASLLKRLGFPAPDEASSKNPFSHVPGFLTFFSGRQVGAPDMLPEGWDGVFQSKSQLDDYKDLFTRFENSDDEPLSAGLPVLSQLGNASAWDIITSNCDPHINEVFTDILYINTNKTIRCVPAIFVRARPYLTEPSLKNKTIVTQPELLDDWPLYDEVPRVKIDPAVQISLELNNTCTDSPNYIRADFHPATNIFDSNASQVVSTLLQHRIEPLMRRFGGQQLPIQSQYTILKDPTTWFNTLTELGAAWYSELYRTASGTILIKDNSTPLTIGFNVEFQFGTWTLVAQVDAISVSMHVTEQGFYENQTRVSFSRLMMARPDGTLDYLPTGAFTDIFMILSTFDVSSPSNAGADLTPPSGTFDIQQAIDLAKTFIP
jgi:hypothetical protein